jgi:hypothetical protein
VRLPSVSSAIRSGTRRAAVVVPLIASWLAMAPAASADALSDLEKAQGAYVAHRYADAEARLRALLDPQTGTLKDADSVADARMYLGAVLIAEGKKDEGARVLEQLLIEKPDYQPDPLRVSLQATDALIDARSRLRDKLAAILEAKVRLAQEDKAKLEGEKQKAAKRLAMLEQLASEEVVTEHNSRWIALIPFGVGQFQNREDAWGGVFLASESLLILGSVVGAALSLYNAGQVPDALARGDGTAIQYNTRAQLAAKAGNWFTAGFALVGLGGIVHAELGFVPEHVAVRKRVIPQLSLAPVLGPGSVGLAGTF